MNYLAWIAGSMGAGPLLRLTGICLFTLFFAVAPQAHSTNRPAGGLAEVDLQLILAVDVSPSMSRVEQRVQRDGYVGALRHADIARAIKSGERGRIAVLYLEWAGPSQQTVIVPWTIVESRQDALTLADRLAVLSLTEGRGTSISGALSAAKDLFAKSGLRSPRRVIDVSGDGPNNAGALVDPIRQVLLAEGVTINGLPIALPRIGGADGFARYDPSNLQSYFERCVIGGPDAFSIGVTEAAMFATAVRRKLVREISMNMGEVIHASYAARSDRTVDCNMIAQSPGR
ncbi:MULTISPECIES: DUF1194 domain-containing protein [unclassified Mesorhizobium]|uniref:DUF1194 domain-containing protein n=1 Tax=unclassified Mesorhizobium TaxID=325217 RepID=UPI000BDB3C51|nr:MULTISPECIES: DUF1194 domain-containing protein [unclassified Mesorhizobium]TGT57258.1 DUF1194 domain-containing protein [Mesorhizobium sp. M00.F.Ca.ET.170.01.1.1]AZO11989.1 DUF1194 domain-containing protein [Mesorhizobium sp. M3A.F.Ca.ET.080.04.2.1]PBB86114.1 hypothetical protein CK216_13425 [Mesorhizobium sp. WSM3876]RWB66723.1 MAG: DUF1194 domain-containing protein [Mesorhizobium sp.]RWB90673.1 MAG: DUF1194 domain-containing protein [Mesorhizobium sp.]